jgi:hypothetical protein
LVFGDVGDTDGGDLLALGNAGFFGGFALRLSKSIDGGTFALIATTPIKMLQHLAHPADLDNGPGWQGPEGHLKGQGTS